MTRTTGDMTLDRLRTDGQRFMEEISREHYLASSGQKETAELSPIYARYGHVMNEESLALVLERFKGATPGSEEHRGARLLLEWQAEAQSSRELASLDVMFSTGTRELAAPAGASGASAAPSIRPSSAALRINRALDMSPVPSLIAV